MVKVVAKEYVVADDPVPLATLPRNLNTEETVQEEDIPTATNSLSTFTSTPPTNPPPPLSFPLSP